MFNKTKKIMSKLFNADRRGQITLGSMPGVLLSLVFVAAIAVGGFLAIDGIQSGLTVNSEGANASAAIETGMGNIFDQFSTIGTLIGVGLLLAVIVVGFSVANRKGFV